MYLYLSIFIYKQNYFHKKIPSPIHWKYRRELKNCARPSLVIRNSMVSQKIPLFKILANVNGCLPVVDFFIFSKKTSGESWKTLFRSMIYYTLLTIYNNLQRLRNLFFYMQHTNSALSNKCNYSVSVVELILPSFFRLFLIAARIFFLSFMESERHQNHYEHRRIENPVENLR